MDEYTNILMHDQFITGAGIFIDTKQHTAHLLGSIRKIHIIKFCRNEHYKASIKNIIPYQFENENRIAVPDHVTYEELKIRVKGCYGATTIKENGSLVFTNQYNMSETHILTTNGIQVIPLIPLNKLNFADIPETIRILEQYIMLA